MSPLAVQGAPAGLGLLIPDWAGGLWKEWIRSFCKAFGPEDPVGVLVRIEPATASQTERALAELESLVKELGLPDEELPEIILENTPLVYSDRPGLFTACDVLLDCGGRRSLVHRRQALSAGLSVLSVGEAEDLRSSLGLASQSEASTMSPVAGEAVQSTKVGQ